MPASSQGHLFFFLPNRDVLIQRTRTTITGKLQRRKTTTTSTTHVYKWAHLLSFMRHRLRFERCSDNYDGRLVEYERHHAKNNLFGQPPHVRRSELYELLEVKKQRTALLTSLLDLASVMMNIEHVTHWRNNFHLQSSVSCPCSNNRIANTENYFELSSRFAWLQVSSVFREWTNAAHTNLKNCFKSHLDGV